MRLRVGEHHSSDAIEKVDPYSLLSTAVHWLVVWISVSLALVLLALVLTLLTTFDFVRLSAGDWAYVQDWAQWVLNLTSGYGVVWTVLIASFGAAAAQAWVNRFESSRALFKQTMSDHLVSVTKQLEIQAKAASQGAYTELDKFYSDILKMGMQYPYLRFDSNPANAVDPLSKILEIDFDPLANQQNYKIAGMKAINPDSWTIDEAVKFVQLESGLYEHRRAQYEAYAFIVWNFIETVHDRCQQYPDDLLDTWAQIVAAENALHRGWFLQQMAREAKRQKQMGGAYSRTDKFCKDFQIFIFEGNFLPEPGVGDGVFQKYPRWSYYKDDPRWNSALPEHHEPTIKRDFDPKAVPVAVVDGQTINVW